MVTALVLCLLAGSSDRALAEETIVDGSFESGEFPEFIGSAPDSTGFWSVGAFETGGPPVAVTDPVLSGDYAVQLDTRSAAHGRTIFQDIIVEDACFTWTFNVNRGEGTNWAEIIAGWRGGEPAGRATLLVLSDASVELRTWDSGGAKVEPLSTDEWHEIKVEVDSTIPRQTLSIDGEVAATVDAEDGKLAPETMIIGDVAGNALQGLYTYDDVSLETHTCASDGAITTVTETQPPTVNAEEDTADQAEGDDDGGSGFPWWLIVLILILLLILFLILLILRRRRKEAEAD